MSERFVTCSPEETRNLAEQLANELDAGDVIALIGELGSGKTTFVQGLARGLGVSNVVNSPTFKLVNELEGRLPLYHIDFFRIDSAKELVNLGLEHYLFGDGVTVIEWADRYTNLLPDDAIIIELLIPGEMEREIVVSGLATCESPGH